MGGDTDEDEGEDDGHVYNYGPCSIDGNLRTHLGPLTEVFRTRQITSFEPDANEWTRLIGFTNFGSDGKCKNLCEFKIKSNGVNWSERDPIIPGVPQGFLDYHAYHPKHFERNEIKNPLK